MAPALGQALQISAGRSPMVMSGHESLNDMDEKNENYEESQMEQLEEEDDTPAEMEATQLEPDQDAMPEDEYSQVAEDLKKTNLSKDE